MGRVFVSKPVEDRDERQSGSGKRTSRSYSAAYKQRILEELDAASEPGKTASASIRTAFGGQLQPLSIGLERHARTIPTHRREPIERAPQHKDDYARSVMKEVKVNAGTKAIPSSNAISVITLRIHESRDSRYGFGRRSVRTRSVDHLVAVPLLLVRGEVEPLVPSTPAGRPEPRGQCELPATEWCLRSEDVVGDPREKPSNALAHVSHMVHYFECFDATTNNKRTPS